MKVFQKWSLKCQANKKKYLVYFIALVVVDIIFRILFLDKIQESSQYMVLYLYNIYSVFMNVSITYTGFSSAFGYSKSIKNYSLIMNMIITIIVNILVELVVVIGIRIGSHSGFSDLIGAVFSRLDFESVIITIKNIVSLTKITEIQIPFALYFGNLSLLISFIFIDLFNLFTIVAQFIVSKGNEDKSINTQNSQKIKYACPVCGNEVGSNHDFCLNCGNKLDHKIMIIDGKIIDNKNEISEEELPSLEDID